MVSNGNFKGAGDEHCLNNVAVSVQKIKSICAACFMEIMSIHVKKWQTRICIVDMQMESVRKPEDQGVHFKYLP
jgi:hypothetical protein